MDRIEKLREAIDGILLAMSDPQERRCGYVHLYGVAQACALLALRRGQDVELAVMAGMLHDLATYKTMDSTDHGPRSAIMARKMLTEMGLATPEEIDIIAGAVAVHTDKPGRYEAFAEVLIDADVMQHWLYNPTREVGPAAKERLGRVLKELGCG